MKKKLDKKKGEKSSKDKRTEDQCDKVMAFFWLSFKTSQAEYLKNCHIQWFIDNSCFYCLPIQFYFWKKTVVGYLFPVPFIDIIIFLQVTSSSQAEKLAAESESVSEDLDKVSFISFY